MNSCLIWLTGQAPARFGMVPRYSKREFSMKTPNEIERGIDAYLTSIALKSQAREKAQ